jgi:hypothetical protein
VNHFAGGFRGRYILSLVGSNSPALHGNFKGNSVQIDGCSSTNIDFNMSTIINVTNGTYKHLNSTTKNKKTCTDDIDNQYLTALQSIDGFIKFDLGFYLTKSGVKII